jgi:ubiquinone/menaquinone biosynthesis C-methylase UbiE
VRINYSTEPKDPQKFTHRFSIYYTLIAGFYDFCVKALPFWRRWLRSTIPYIKGNKVLELSFGTGYLLTNIANKFEVYGLELNDKMIAVAKKNLDKQHLSAKLFKGNVEAMPFDDNFFDTVVSTMSFPAYPNADKAMKEIYRVLKPQGRLTMVMVNFPRNQNVMGTLIVRLWKKSGEVIRDMPPIFKKYNFDFTEKEMGPFDVVHLYIADKKNNL